MTELVEGLLVRASRASLPRAAGPGRRQQRRLGNVFDLKAGLPA